MKCCHTLPGKSLKKIFSVGFNAWKTDSLLIINLLMVNNPIQWEANIPPTLKILEPIKPLLRRFVQSERHIFFIILFFPRFDNKETIFFHSCFIYTHNPLKGLGAFWQICTFSIFFVLMGNFLSLRNSRIKTFSNTSCHFSAYFV